MLTDTAIKSLTVTSAKFFPDRDGLYLHVQPTGTKTFYIRRTNNGKRQWVRLGSYPQMSLKDARKAASNKDTLSSEAGIELSKVFESYYKHVCTQYKKPEQVKRIYLSDLSTTIGSTPINKLSRKDITDVLQKIVDRGSPVMANRTLAVVKHLFEYAVSKGYIAADPVAGVKPRFTGGKETPKKRVLTDAELLDFWKEFYSTRFHLKTRIAWALILVTGQRPSEVLGVSRAEIVNRVSWVIPDSRALKSDSGHTVHLSIQARALLRIAFMLFGDYPLLADHRVLSRAFKRKGVTYTPHDLRRTCATRMASLGIYPHVVEKVLNHKMEGTMAVYNQFDYLPEKRAALDLWGKTIKKTRRLGRVGGA